LIGTLPTLHGDTRSTPPAVMTRDSAAMMLRWTAAGMMEAAKGFRRLKAYKQLPALKAALLAHQAKHAIRNSVADHVAHAATDRTAVRRLAGSNQRAAVLQIRRAARERACRHSFRRSEIPPRSFRPRIARRWPSS
jgi:hypothetical protein